MTMRLMDWRMRCLCVLLVSGLAACATSTPARYYTLDASVPSGGGEPAGSPAVTLVVGPVDLPAYVDRPQLAVRIADGQLEFRDFDRWAEPLEDGFKRVLVRNLATLMPESRVVQHPFPRTGKSDYRLGVRISRFEAGQGGDASLEAQWTITDRQGTVVVPPRRDEFTRQAAAPNTAALVAAQSATVADLAATIARIIAALPPPPSPAPPPL